MFLDGFEDLRNEIELTVAEPGLVAAHQTPTGTHTGAFLGLEPTGRRVELTSTAAEPPAERQRPPSGQ